MRITLRGHSCLELSTIDGSLLIDPGSFSTLQGAFTGKNAVLITHQHADHADQPAITAAVLADPVLDVYAPPALAQILRSEVPAAHRAQIHPVGVGMDLVLGGIRVRTFGGTHATIHHSIELVANVGYLLGDARLKQPTLFHPGDSYQVPIGITPDVLLLPIMGPWGKMAEAADFALATRAPLWVPIHDGLLNERGKALFDRQLSNLAGHNSARYQRLEAETPADLRELLADSSRGADVLGSVEGHA